MVDIEAYDEYENYMKFQKLRPDYVQAIDKSIELAKKYSAQFDKINLADFCSGTGSNSKIFSEQLNKVNKVTLIDINKGFLDIARKSGIKSSEISLHVQDILKVKLNKEYNLVFSIFAYHHIKDNEKQKYIKQVRRALQNKGILVLTEIFIKNKKETIEYYSRLFNQIPREKIIPGLKDFLDQTANSNDFEFKVSKEFADKQFKECGFKLLEEVRIYPKYNSFDKDGGTFVQVYQI
jgi:ubiquinone/menaquinone biosynthesis C-methylase UbiE